MCPWQGSLWYLTGIALRLCIDMGLHWETEGQTLNTGPELLYERRRLWYSAYHFDRILGIALGRPFGIIDESARVPLPNPWAVTRPSLNQETNDFDIHYQRAHNHLFSMAKLESEIKHVQHSQTWGLKMAYPKPNFAMWVQDIHPLCRNGTVLFPALVEPIRLLFSRIRLTGTPSTTTRSYSSTGRIPASNSRLQKQYLFHMTPPAS